MVKFSGHVYKVNKRYLIGNYKSKLYEQPDNGVIVYLLSSDFRQSVAFFDIFWVRNYNEIAFFQVLGFMSCKYFKNSVLNYTLIAF